MLCYILGHQLLRSEFFQRRLPYHCVWFLLLSLLSWRWALIKLPRIISKYVVNLYDIDFIRLHDMWPCSLPEYLILHSPIASFLLQYFADSFLHIIHLIL